MDSSLKELSSYRLLRAKEMLAASEENLKMGQLRTSLNRSYYAVFHAMRAVNILEDLIHQNIRPCNKVMRSGEVI